MNFKKIIINTLLIQYPTLAKAKAVKKITETVIKKTKKK